MFKMSEKLNETIIFEPVTSDNYFALFKYSGLFYFFGFFQKNIIIQYVI